MIDGPRVTSRILLALAALSILLAGCGKQERKAPPPHQGFVCERKVPAQNAECIKQEEAFKGNLVKPTVSPSATPVALSGLGAIEAGSAHRPTCSDLSIWDGEPSLRIAKANGMVCTIIQTNDGGGRNRLFFTQAREARNAHMPFGCYTFVEAMSAEYQADILASMCKAAGATLGGWADTEVQGSYGNACPFVHRLTSRWHYPIAGVYASPGTYFGGANCGYAWPAEWGSEGFYPLPGWEGWRVKIRQWCGTCHYPGFSGEVDLSEDIGLLRLAASVHPRSKAELRKELFALYRTRVALRHRINTYRVLLRTRHCKNPPPQKLHACITWKQRGNEAHAAGDRVNARIRALHRQGV